MAYSSLPIYNFSGQDAITVFNTLSTQGYYGVGIKDLSSSQYLVLYTTTTNAGVHLYRIRPNTELSTELDTLFTDSGYPQDNPSIYNYGWLAVSPIPFIFRTARVICTGNPPTGVDSTIRNGENFGDFNSVVVRRNNIDYNMFYAPSGANTEGQGYYVNGIYNLPACSNWDDLDDIPISIIYPITYYPTNVTLSPAPSEAAVGDTVTVGVSVPSGYTLRDPLSSSIVVRNNGVIVPHTWDATTNQFTFEMPDPS